MRWLRHWLGLHIRSDWHWQHESTHPALVLQRPPQPGWYMLTVTLKAEQQRCYGVFNGTQSRLLISNRRRRRLVRVARREARFALLGVNGCVAIEELRLVRQPFWRVKRLLRGKLLALHPAYPASTMPSQPLNKLWCDYNRLVGRRVHALVGYDAWIEQVERPSLHGDEPSDTPTLSFAIWLHGDRSEHDACERSIASLEGQLRGDYRLLDRDQQLEGGDLQCWVVLLRVGDVLASQALQRLAMVIGAHSEVAVVYSDEDRISQTGRRHSPQFKPAWNPDLLYSDPHYSNSWCLRSDVCLTACESLQADVQQAELYSLVLEATHLVKAEQIVHLPEVLYHHADADDGARGSAASVATLQRFLERHQQRADAIVRPGGGHVLHWPLPAEAPCVSVIIPTRDQGKMLRRCIESLTSHIDDRLEVEIIIMDNDSQEDETLAYLAHLKTLPNFQVHRCPGEFNYAAINNQGVGLARGDLIAFINNDIEAIHHGWLSTMVAHACRLEVGAVGARLLYADGTVQHGGVVLGIGGIAGHAHKYLPGEAEGYQLRLQLTQTMSAVTAAALVIRRLCFEAVDGFDADTFAVNYNDVDLCLRLMAAGYRNVYCPEAALVHHESKSRGVPIEGDRSHQQWQQERQAMVRRWGELLLADPFYSPHLSLTEEDLSLALHGAMGTAGRKGTGAG